MVLKTLGMAVPVMVKVSPLTAVVIPVAPAILIVSHVFNVVPEESSPTMVIGELVRYELKLGPVMVRVSPDTAVVTFCEPAILIVSPGLKNVPVESSPTSVNPLPTVVQVNCPAPSVFKTCPAVPSDLGQLCEYNNNSPSASPDGELENFT